MPITKHKLAHPNCPYTPKLAAPPGLAFCKTVVLLGPIDEQLAVPHPQPLGQQFPPTLAAHVSQPEAQAPVGVATLAAEPTGTTTVTPLLMIVVELVGGQDVFSQLRPVRQQPPS